MSGKILVERNGPVTTIVINRPERRNALDLEATRLLVEALRSFESDETADAAVLTGAGGSFCAGADLKELADAGAVYEPWAGPNGPTHRPLTKPVVAAVSGHAVAGGLGLAVWCDLRVADETAVFGVFCRRWGVPMSDGTTVRLPRLIGQGRALDMLMTGRPVEAREALAIGLADRVVAAGEARTAAEALAAEIAAFPPLAMRADRWSAFGQSGVPIEQALEHEIACAREAKEKEAQSGAGRFAGGAGRHGSFERS